MRLACLSFAGPPSRQSSATRTLCPSPQSLRIIFDNLSFAFHFGLNTSHQPLITGTRMSQFMKSAAALGGCIGVFTAVVAVVEMLAG